MKRIANVAIYLSAFLPIFMVMWVREVILVAIQEFSYVQKAQPIRLFDWRVFLEPYLIIGFAIIMVVALLFSALLRGNKRMATKLITVLKAKNQVAEYYMGYYSLFVLALIGFSLTSIADVISLCLLMTVLGIAYIKNGLYYMNPTVSIMRSFIYEIEFMEGNKTNSKIIIAKEKIYAGDTISVYLSEYDFILMEKKVTA